MVVFYKKQKKQSRAHIEPVKQIKAQEPPVALSAVLLEAARLLFMTCFFLLPFCV